MIPRHSETELGSARLLIMATVVRLDDAFLSELDILCENDEEGNLQELYTDNDSNNELTNIESHDLNSVSGILQSEWYACTIQKVEEAMNENSSSQVIESEEDQAGLIIDCNGLVADIENEIVIAHNFIRDNYRFKFPELASLVSHPVDYAQVVKLIGNEVDLTLINLERVLPSAIIMVVSITASTTSGKPLPEETLQKTIDACDRVLALDSAKNKLLDFVGSRMECIAPNLSAIVGTVVAAKLMCTAGGLSTLANMRPSFVLLCGRKRKNLAGFSRASSQSHVGYLEQTEIFQSTPPSLRARACRLLATKSVLAARIDSVRGNATGVTGTAYRAEILKKIELWQKAPPAKQLKPLPVPNLNSKKKRGGRRLRKTKERYAVTNMRRLANRMQFGVPEESSLGDGLGEGYGMLTSAGSLKRRLPEAVVKKSKEKSYQSSGLASQLTTNLAFSTVEGLELANPGDQFGGSTQSSYFSETGGFSNIKRRKT